MKEVKNAKAVFKLPERLVTSVDLARTTRELKKLDDWLHQSQIRTPGQNVTPPKTSATLEELAIINGVSLLDQSQRAQLIVVLEGFLLHAPKIHMSFAVEPSPSFLQTTIAWLRTNVNPVALLDVGLQPSIAAGCTVRTNNKLFDLSLRHRFIESRDQLVASIAATQEDAPVEAKIPIDTPAAPPLPVPVAAAVPPQVATPSQVPAAAKPTEQAAS